MDRMEIFRIKGLLGLIEKRYFSDGNLRKAGEELARKCRIYASGCRKRGKYNESAHYENLARRFV